MAIVMTMSPTAVRTARRNLVRRIDRFVRRMQTESFQPGPDAIANFEVALECLERADYPGGEDTPARPGELVVPLLTPVLIGAARATAPLWAVHPHTGDLAKWAGVLGLYDLVFVLLSVAVFDFLLED